MASLTLEVVGSIPTEAFFFPFFFFLFPFFSFFGCIFIL